MERFIKGASLIVGGVALGTAGVVLGATLGVNSAGPAVAILSLMAALVMVDAGVSKW